MDILLVASEFAPWVQHTGVAEVVACFSKTLKQIGHTVTVMVPFRKAYDQSGLLLARRLSKLKLADSRELSVYDTQLTSGVQLVFADLGVEDSKPFGLDDAIVFAQAVAALINDRSNLGVHTDIVHVHDWLGSFVSLAIEQIDGPRPPTVVSLHDGIEMPQLPEAIEPTALSRLGAAQRDIVSEGIGLAAVAVRTAKGVITSSHEQARQLMDPVHAGPLAQDLHSNPRPVLGIPAGVDYSRANPAIDPQLPSRFDAEDCSHKSTCKGAFQRQLGLELDISRPLLFISAPLRHVQGQVIVEVLPRLLDYTASIVVAQQPTDDPAFADQVRAIAQQWPSRIGLLSLGAERPHTPALGAADLVLLGQASSPLDAHHLFALRYGAVPIADLAGVHADQLLDCDAKLQTGNCFAFAVWTAEQVQGAIARGISAWEQAGFERLRRRIMRLDLGWERPTRRAMQLYRQVLGIKV